MADPVTHAVHSDTKPYKVVVTREGKAWLANIPSLVGAHTFSRTLRGLDKSVREVIALADELPMSAMPRLVLDFEYHVDHAEIDEDTAAVRKLRDEAEALEARRTALTAKTARALAERGLPVRDVATLLNVSYQWVSHLTGIASTR
jgi:hypothetical protein